MEFLAAKFSEQDGVHGGRLHLVACGEDQRGDEDSHAGPSARADEFRLAGQGSGNEFRLPQGEQTAHDEALARCRARESCAFQQQ